MNWTKSAEPAKNQQPTIKSEADEIPSELMLWENSSQNLQLPINREEDEVLHPNDPPEPAECYAIKTEEVHIYSVLPEEEIHEPSERPPVRRSARNATSSKTKDKPKQTGEFSCSTCGMKCPSKARLKQHESKVHQVEIAHRPCLQRGKKFSTEQTLRTHKRQMHKTDTRINIKVKQIQTIPEQPEEADFTFAEEFSSVKNVLKCYICNTDKMFKNVEALNHHLVEFHPHKFSYQCQECNEISISIHIFNRHLSKHDAELRPYKCGMCSSRFSKKNYLLQHEVQVHSINNGRTKRRFCTKCRQAFYVTKFDEHVCSRVDIIHMCLICDLEFFTKHSLNKHVTNVHKTALAPSSVEASQNFKCYLCEPTTNMKDENILLEHLLAVHPRQDVYHCKECNKYFQKTSSYNQHLQRHDASVRPFKCGHCPMRFRKNDTMRKHEVDVHQANNGRTKRRFRKKRNCRICKKTIPIDMLEEHMQTKHLTISHFCSICGMEFLHENNLRQHMKSEHNCTVFKCYLCNSDHAYDGKEHLQKHLEEAHSTQSEYTCGKCNYSTTSVSCFNDHHTEHDDGKEAEQTNPQIGNKQVTNGNDTMPLPRSQISKCYLCEPAIDMKDKTTLREHLSASHARQDVYHCIECDKYVLNISTYNQHLHLHDASERPFKCGHCPLRFRRNKNMRSHEAEVHQANNGWTKRRPPRKRRRCLVCRKTFISENLEEHMQTEHPINGHVS